MGNPIGASISSILFFLLVYFYFIYSKYYLKYVYFTFQ